MLQLLLGVRAPHHNPAHPCVQLGCSVRGKHLTILLEAQLTVPDSTLARKFQGVEHRGVR